MMKIAILGAGGIARAMCATIRGMKEAGRPVELYAVASRDIDKAVRFAREQGVRRAYGSCEDMLADPAVELVYIATPHSHHAEQMKMCIHAGKAVLCEKSFTANAAQAEEVLALAREKGVYVAEAIWTRYMPSRRLIDDLIAAGEIGEPLLLTANLCYMIKDVERVYRPELAGGALLDITIYPLNFAIMTFGDEIERIESSVQMMETGVDRQENITFFYKDGRMAALTASTDSISDRRGMIFGEKGFVEVENINNPQSITIYNDAYQVMEKIPCPEQVSGYEYEVISCLDAIEEGRLECPEMPHADTIAMMKLMDGIRAEWGMKYPCE